MAGVRSLSPRRPAFLLLLLAAVAGAPAAAAEDEASAVRVETFPTAGGDAAHALARPLTVVRLEGKDRRDAVGRVAWLLGVEVSVDARAAAHLDAPGELAFDSQGGDGGDLLELVAGLEARVKGAFIVLYRPGDEPRDELSDEPGAAAPVAAVPWDTPETTLVAGRVVNVAGRPVAGVRVAAEGLPPGRTDAAGRFSCRVPHVGAPLLAWYAGRAQSEPVASTGEGVELRIGPPLARLDVVAVAPDGRALTGLLAHCDGPGEPATEGLRQGDRRVRYDGLLRGRQSLIVSARGHDAVACEATTRLGETTRITVTLEPSTLAARLGDQRATLRHERVRLSAALWELAQRAALPLRFERSAGDALTRAVAIDRENAPVTEILDVLCEAAGATWRVDEEAWLVRVGVD
jgi:hypothetical protein